MLSDKQKALAPQPNINPKTGEVIPDPMEINPATGKPRGSGWVNPLAPVAAAMPPLGQQLGDIASGIAPIPEAPAAVMAPPAAVGMSALMNPAAKYMPNWSDQGPADKLRRRLLGLDYQV